MNSIPWRVQLGMVAAGYVAVIGLAVVLVYDRHMLYINHAAEAAAAGGMYAGGDLLLALFIACLFSVPTFLLILVIRKSETASIRYAKVLLGVSLTFPACFVGLLPAVNQTNSLLGDFCIYRSWTSPLVMAGLVISWLFARFPRAKRLILYALGVEAGTLMIGITIFVIGLRAAQSFH